ncbi:MAG: hypothetical protein IK044_07430 [Methanobrevibacter sp.]|nr:hypothetical protein [Methanobrevibacter sp.]
MEKILITMLIFLMIIPAVSAENDLNSIIDGSNNNDVIILENNIIVSSSMIIDKNLTITSNENSVINGNSNQLFTVTKGNSLTLKGLTIINAYEEYGGAIYNEGTLTIVNYSLNNNRALYYGGAIYNDGDLTIINSTISNNTATNQGGAIHNNLGKITIINFLF